MSKLLLIVFVLAIASCKKERCVKCKQGEVFCHDAKYFDEWKNGFVSQFNCEEI